MSMRDYAVNDYGLLMTEDTMKIMASKYFDDYTEEEYDNDAWAFNDDLYNAGIVEYISQFTGEAIHIDDNGSDEWGTGEDVYDSDSIYYVPMSKWSTLFKAAYKNMDEIIEEFKSKLSEYLPSDFDYRGHIRHIVGTYYG